jgi:RNA polymerase sigma-70 factor (ECF subfamily)
MNSADRTITTHEASSMQTVSPPEKWVDLYGNYLYKYALMRLRNDALAEDAVQETFLAALKAQQTFSGRSSEKTWLVGILKHKIIDTFRKRSRETPMSEAALPFEQEGLFLDNDHEWGGHWKPEYKPTDWSNTPLAATEQRDFQRVFQSCFEKLPERTALAFALKEIDDAECAEICTALEITEANLWVMLHRARMHLRRCLEVRWFAPTKTTKKIE